MSEPLVRDSVLFLSKLFSRAMCSSVLARKDHGPLGMLLDMASLPALDDLGLVVSMLTLVVFCVGCVRMGWATH